MKHLMFLLAVAVVLAGCTTSQMYELNESVCGQEARVRGAAQAVIDYLDTTCPLLKPEETPPDIK